MYPSVELHTLPAIDKSALAAEMLALDGAAVLDIGCGRGAFTCFLAENGARVAGIDPDEERIAAAREAAAVQGLDIDFRVGAGQDLPFEDAAFDIVVYSNSLHHVPLAVIGAALAEAGRVLRPEGLLYVMEPVPAGSYFEVGRPINDETEVRTVAYGHVQALIGAGFEPVAERFAYTPRYFADFAAYKDWTLKRNPQRAALFEEHAEEIAALFETSKRVEGDRVVLDAAIRINLLRKTG